MTVSPTLWIIIIDILAWGFFHLSISMLCFKMPLRYFEQDLPFYKSASWEDNGKVWDKIFFVKKWKGRLIDGSSIMKKSYNKSNLHGSTSDQLAVFSAETKRAELTHWLLMIPAPIFFLWNPVWVGWVMIAYAILVNVPFIVTQRFNRGRIESILRRTRKRNG